MPETFSRVVNLASKPKSIFLKEKSLHSLKSQFMARRKKEKITKYLRAHYAGFELLDIFNQLVQENFVKNVSKQADYLPCKLIVAAVAILQRTLDLF